MPSIYWCRCTWPPISQNESCGTLQVSQGVKCIEACQLVCVCLRVVRVCMCMWYVCVCACGICVCVCVCVWYVCVCACVYMYVCQTLHNRQECMVVG